MKLINILQEKKNQHRIPSSITTHRDAVRTKQAEMIKHQSQMLLTLLLYKLYILEMIIKVRPLADLPRLS